MSWGCAPQTPAQAGGQALGWGSHPLHGHAGREERGAASAPHKELPARGMIEPAQCPARACARVSDGHAVPGWVPPDANTEERIFCQLVDLAWGCDSGKGTADRSCVTPCPHGEGRQPSAGARGLVYNTCLRVTLPEGRGSCVTGRGCPQGCPWQASRNSVAFLILKCEVWEIRQGLSHTL